MWRSGCKLIKTLLCNMLIFEFVLQTRNIQTRGQYLNSYSNEILKNNIFYQIFRNFGVLATFAGFLFVSEYIHVINTTVQFQIGVNFHNNISTLLFSHILFRIFHKYIQINSQKLRVDIFQYSASRDYLDLNIRPFLNFIPNTTERLLSQT